MTPGLSCHVSIRQLRLDMTLESFPVPIPNAKSSLPSMVEQMLVLHKQLAEAKEPQTKTVLQRRIETTDRQIDRLVYELYELTEDEIKIVEGS